MRVLIHGRRLRVGALIALGIAGAIAVVVLAVTSSRDQDSGGATPTGGPIDRTQQTALSFGDRSHWLQPWRGYLDTLRATKLRAAIGINIDNSVAAGEVPALARLLAANGFKRARYEIGWGSTNYDNPAKLSDPGSVDTVLKARRALSRRTSWLEPGAETAKSGSITPPCERLCRGARA